MNFDSRVDNTYILVEYADGEFRFEMPDDTHAFAVNFANMVHDIAENAKCSVVYVLDIIRTLADLETDIRNNVLQKNK